MQIFGLQEKDEDREETGALHGLWFSYNRHDTDLKQQI